MKECSIELPANMKGMIDNLMENTALTAGELINLGLFLYHLDIFISLNESDIENVKLWLFIDKTEQKWLKALCEYHNKNRK